MTNKCRSIPKRRANTSADGKPPAATLLATSAGARVSQCRRSQKAKHPRHKSGYPRSGHKDWRKSADKALDVFICVGHIMAVLTIVVEHVF